MIPSWLPDFTIAYFIFSLVFAARLYQRGIEKGYRRAIAVMPLLKFDELKDKLDKLDDSQLDELEDKFDELEDKLRDDLEDKLFDKLPKVDKLEDKQ